MKGKWLLFLHSQKNREWSVGQGVKTPPFHGGITGSIPVRSTGKGKLQIPNAVMCLGFLVLYYDLWLVIMKDREYKLPADQTDERIATQQVMQNVIRLVS